MPIFPCDPFNVKELRNFEVSHNKHMIQTVNYNEIPSSYVFIKGKNAKELTLNIIQEMLISKC